MTRLGAPLDGAPSTITVLAAGAVFRLDRNADPGTGTLFFSLFHD